MIGLEVHSGIAVVSVDNPPVNVITAGVRHALNQVLDGMEARSDVRALVLRCAGSTFFSGADIGEFGGPPREGEYRSLFGRLEMMQVPVVAALHGTVLGGGLEIALACHYRVAAAGTRLGFPELTLGIIPGAGGTQRLPRLTGADKALKLIFDARPIPVEEALQLGILDSVAADDVEAAAIGFARELIANEAPPRRTCERAVDPLSAAPEVFAHYAEEARRLYPNREAPHAAIASVRNASQLPFCQGLMKEDELVNHAKTTVESRAAIHVFFAERATRTIPGLPGGGRARSVQSAGIVGGGTMGAGIAVCFANAGIPVTLVETDDKALRAGIERIERTYASMVQRGRLGAVDKEKRLALISGAIGHDALGSADIIVEAAYEDMALKRDIFSRLDKVAKPGAVLATNTSTLDIAEIAAATSRPQDVIGMHFFSPANVMPLLEVVRTDKTSPEVIRTVLELSKPLRKTPVLANVCYGFIGNRMMEGYAREAERMVLEGARPDQVDGALEAWGMAMGILAVFDMAGIDVGVNVHRANADRYPPDATYYQADFALAEAGRLGQKSGKGYYRYVSGDRKRHVDPEAIEILRRRAAALQVPQRDHSQQELVERCLYAMINEGFRLLSEGIAVRAADIDVVWTSGYGFPRYRGGPMFHAEALGLKSVLAGVEKYRDAFGPMHWQPAPLLEELAHSGRSVAAWERGR